MTTIYEKLAEGIIAVSDPDADARRAQAWADDARLGALKTITADEANAYIDEQVTLNIAKADALTLVANAASLDDIKNLLSALVVIVYSIADILKLMALLLIALRDYVKPDVVDKT
jgi:hypothetical protein